MLMCKTLLSTTLFVCELCLELGGHIRSWKMCIQQWCTWCTELVMNLSQNLHLLTSMISSSLFQKQSEPDTNNVGRWCPLWFAAQFNKRTKKKLRWVPCGTLLPTTRFGSDVARRTTHTHFASKHWWHTQNWPESIKKSYKSINVLKE